MKRKIFIVLFAVSLLLVSCGQGNKNTTPNILWILAEDLSPDLGCYGNEHVFTPNVDWLAREGTRFLNVFTTGPCLHSQPDCPGHRYVPDIPGRPPHALSRGLEKSFAERDYSDE